MELKQIIDICFKANVELKTDGEQLELLFDEHPEDELLDLIRTHKAGLIRYLQGGVTPDEKSAADPGGVKLSASQKALWLTHQLDNNHQLNLVKAVEISGDFHIQAAQQAITALVHRHCALRTAYTFVEGEVFQEINNQACTQISIEPFHGVDTDVNDERVAQLIDQTAATSFDLTSGDLLRVKFIQLGANHGILVFCVHHIAADGWSLGLIVRDFCQYYQASLDRGVFDLPAVDTAYRDLAQRETLATAAGQYKEALHYWENKLSNMPHLHGLSLDTPRPKTKKFCGKSIAKALTSEMVTGLSALAHQQRVTLFHLFHAAFTILLARHSDSQDIVVGTMVANRLEGSEADIVGNFAQPAVLRQQLPFKASFVDYLQLVMSSSLELLEHQHVPFEMIKAMHKSEQGNSYHPLFQIMFSMDTSAKSKLSLSGCELKELAVARDVAEFDLTLRVLTGDNEQAALVFEYDTDIFNSETIETYGEHLLNLLREILHNPQEDIHALNMLGNDEQALITRLSGYQQDFADDGQTLMTLFERQVSRSPSASALIYQGRAISYQELNRQVNTLAAAVTRCTFAPGALVGICLDRSVDMVIALLAVLKANRIYVPLDPSYPKHRLEYMLTDAAITTVVANERAVAEVCFEQVDYILLEHGHCNIRQQVSRSPTPANVIADPDCFNLVYTSGSTGVPKGIMGSQKSFINRLQWMWQQAPYVEGDIACLRTSLNFIDHVCEIFSPLLQGIPAVLLDNDQSRDVAQMAHVLDEHKVTHVFMVPSLLRELLHYPKWLGHHLKVCLSCGETLDSELAIAFTERFTDTSLYNVYGSTEVSADVAFYDAGQYRDDISSAPRVPVGKPIANSKIFILGAQGRYLSPVGAQGEIYIGGNCLSLGYSDQQLTSQRFITSALLRTEKLFKTGDLGRWNKQGQLEFIGRRDEQVKVNGCRIELGEVETVLQRSDLVAGAKVITLVDVQGRNRLVAYIVASDKSAKSSELLTALRSEARQNLVSFMVPSHFVIIDQFPLLPNGKIDKKALEKRPLPTGAVTATAPRDALEQTLCDIWQQLAQVEEIGIYDNFFDIGGNSLLIMSFTREIEERFGLRIPASKIFEGMTVAFCAQYLAKLQALALDCEPTDFDEVIEL